MGSKEKKKKSRQPVEEAEEEAITRRGRNGARKESESSNNKGSGFADGDEVSVFWMSDTLLDVVEIDVSNSEIDEELESNAEAIRRSSQAADAVFQVFNNKYQQQSLQAEMACAQQQGELIEHETQQVQFGLEQEKQERLLGFEQSCLATSFDTFLQYQLKEETSGTSRQKRCSKELPQATFVEQGTLMPQAKTTHCRHEAKLIRHECYRAETAMKEQEQRIRSRNIMGQDPGKAMEYGLW